MNNQTDISGNDYYSRGLPLFQNNITNNTGGPIRVRLRNFPYTSSQSNSFLFSNLNRSNRQNTSNRTYTNNIISSLINPVSVSSNTNDNNTSFNTHDNTTNTILEPSIFNVPNTANIPVDDDYSQFLETILLAGLGRRLNMPNNIQNLLHSTLNQKNKYKQVLSDEGKEQLLKSKYDKEKYPDQECCIISQKKFKEGDDVIELPCGHIFEPDMITHWLEKENPSCPICRFKLKSKEVKIENNSIRENRNENTDNNNDSEQPQQHQQQQQPQQQQPQQQHDIEMGLNTSSPNSTEESASNSNTTVPIFSIGNRQQTRDYIMQTYRNMILRRQQQLEEQDLQAALIASLETYEQSQNTTNSSPNQVNNGGDHSDNNADNNNIDSDDDIDNDILTDDDL